MTTKICIKCGRTLPISDFETGEGAYYYERKKCSQCINAERALRERQVRYFWLEDFIYND